MTINELIERLEEYRDQIGGDAEVRLMTKQDWPFKNSFTDGCSGEDINDAADDDLDDNGDVDADAVLYIVKGQQLGYGTQRAWEVAYQTPKSRTDRDRSAMVCRA